MEQDLIKEGNRTPQQKWKPKHNSQASNYQPAASSNTADDAIQSTSGAAIICTIICTVFEGPYSVHRSEDTGALPHIRKPITCSDDSSGANTFIVAPVAEYRYKNEA